MGFVHMDEHVRNRPPETPVTDADPCVETDLDLENTCGFKEKLQNNK